jgi:hypothetical protein
MFRLPQGSRHTPPMTFVVTVTLVPACRVTLFGRLVLGPVRALALHIAAFVLIKVAAGVSAVDAGLKRPAAA